MRRIEIHVPELPPQALSSNGSHGSAYAVTEARGWLRRVVAGHARAAAELEGLEAPFARAREGVVASVFWRRRFPASSTGSNFPAPSTRRWPDIRAWPSVWRG